MAIDLLTAEEKKLLKPVIKIMDEVISKYHVAGTSDADEKLNQMMNDDFEALVKKKKLNRKKLMDLTDRVLESKWFCVFMSGAKPAEDPDTHEKHMFMMRPVHSFVISDNPDIQIEITPEVYPDFFTLAERLNEQRDNVPELYRDALKLSDEYMILDVENMQAIMTIFEVFSKTIVSHPLSRYSYLADKLNGLKVWNTTEEQNKKNLFVQINQNIRLYFKINFDGLTDLNIPKSLTTYDKFVYCTVYSMWLAGYRRMSLSMIYKNMGYTSRPNSDAIKDLYDSLTKMALIRIFVDNKEEADVFPNYRRKRIRDEQLLAFNRDSDATINGMVTESYITLLSEPCLGKFSRERNQIRFFDMNVLRVPLNRNETNLKLFDYLWYVICMTKNTGKLTKETLFKHIGIADANKMTKNRVYNDYVRRILVHFKEVGLIANYRIYEEYVWFDKGAGPEKDEQPKIAGKKRETIRTI